MQEEEVRLKEAESSHQAELAASTLQLEQASALHAAMLADVTAAHNTAMTAAQARGGQAEKLIDQLRAEHAEEVAQCDAEYEEAHASRRSQALKVF